MKTLKHALFGLAVTFLVSSCDENGDLVLFSIEDDKQLGEQVAAEIANDPNTYPILSRSEYAEAYSYLDDMYNAILASTAVTYRDEFNWEISIVKDDDVLNAFATPGGKVYVYTGLILFLDKEDDLAGVIGHEIAHADRRHSSKQLQAQYGISTLLSILTGGGGNQITEIVSGLAVVGAQAQFSQASEAEADDFSVEYLSDTKYACNGAASFFEKLTDGQGNTSTSGIEQFLSTHPASDSRIEDINAKAAEVGCDTTVGSESITNYQAFQNSIL